MPESPPLFPQDMLTDDPGPFFIADVIRAQINHRLKKELPHAVAVAVDNITETEAATNIHATIYVEKSSQRPIVIGNQARMIRAIRRASEKELTAIYDKPHKLELWVSRTQLVRNYWMLNSATSSPLPEKRTKPTSLSLLAPVPQRPAEAIFQII